MKVWVENMPTADGEEIILEIREATWKGPPGRQYESFSGYEIRTNLQTIRLMIEDIQWCCEKFGYLLSEDDIQRFVNAKLLGVKITDVALNTSRLLDRKVNPRSSYFEGGILFVDIETSVGVLQFTAYNGHNGYYGHDVIVESTQLYHQAHL
jgi:hypothetical protein